MEMMVVIASLIIVALAYLHVSRLDGSLVNVLTPDMAVFVPANYLVDILLLSTNRPGGSLYAYILTYGSYAMLYASTALGYSLRVKRVRLPLSARAIDGPPMVAWVLLAAACMLYLPVLVEFHAYLANPRQIYELTRQGYGQYFFLSTMLCYLAAVLLLYSSAGVVQRILFFVISLLFLYLHGSKGQMLIPLFILAIWWVYARGHGISMAGLVLFVVLMAGVGVGLFMVTNPTLLAAGGVEGIVAYSDYTRNGMLVIDSGTGPMFGSLKVESELFTRVPRALFPDKPTIYGDFRLAEQFFPEAFNRGTGAPAFGFGSLFADYGVAALAVLGLFGFLKGILLRIFATNVRAGGSPGDMIMLLFGAGIPLIPFAGTFLLPESLVLAVVANCLLGLSSRRSGDQRNLAGAAT